MNILYFEKNINYSNAIVEIYNKSICDIERMLLTTSTLGFYYLYDYNKLQNDLELLLNQLLNSNFFSDSWKISVINFIDWIDRWNYLIDKHNSSSIFTKKVKSSYCIIDMKKQNSYNPPLSVILCEKTMKEKYKVIQGGFLPKSNFELSTYLLLINKKYSKLMATIIKDFFGALNDWIDESGNEIILDPHYYNFNL